MEESVSGGNEKGAEEMTPQTEFLNILCDTVEKECNLSHKISLLELSEKNGLYAELGEGFSDTQYYDKSAVRTIPVLFLCRDTDQKRGMEELCKICNYLQKLKKYPAGKLVSWLDAKTVKEPNKIGRDEDGTYHFSCIINCQIYF